MDSEQTLGKFYAAFREIIRLVHSSTDVAEILELVVWKITEVFGAKGALVRLHDLNTDQLQLGAAYGLSETYLAKGPVSSKQLVIDACKTPGVVIIDDILNSPRLQYPKEAWEEGIRTMLEVPLTLKENAVGLIRVAFSNHRSFSPEELDFVTAIAQQASCAIDKARLFEKQQSQYDHLVFQTEKLAALGRMAAGIAHEINNPLAGILLFSSNLKKKLPESGPHKQALEVIIHETIRCRSIIQDLLEFARDKESRKIPGNINAILERALSLLENEFHLHRVRIEKDLAPDMPDTLLDVGQMQQVFVNLLLNAVEAIGSNGRIGVSSRVDPAKKRILIEVSDSGCGIAPENLPKVFEPFFSTKVKGTGLGLAVSYGIVQNHQGKIQASSIPGKGSLFTIEIPVSKKAFLEY